MEALFTIRNDRETQMDDRNGRGSNVTEVAGHLEALDHALERLRLDGALFMRCEFSENWTFDGGGRA